MLTGMNTSSITVWIVEDRADYRETVSHLLNHVSGMACPMAFEDCESALELLDAHAGRVRPWTLPDVLLLDVNLPGMSGLDGISALKTRLPRTHIVMLTIRDDKEAIHRSLQAGASGYLFKNTSLDHIIEAVRQAANGGLLMPASVAEKVLHFFQSSGAVPQDDFGMTPREIEVLREMADGYTQKEIADRLFIAPSTVNTHLQHIYEKLHVRCGPEAVAKAIRAGLIG